MAYKADACVAAVQYLDVVREVIASGVHRPDRTGTGTLSVFGRSLRFDLRHSFPLLTTKKVFFRGQTRTTSSDGPSPHSCMMSAVRIAWLWGWSHVLHLSLQNGTLQEPQPSHTWAPASCSLTAYCQCPSEPAL